MKAPVISCLFMRKFLFLAVMLCCQFIGSAQKNKDPNVPPFGQVSKEDLLLKTCEFDDKAEAMVLLDDGVLQFVYGSGMELKRRIRIKILNSKGLDWANVHLPYRLITGGSQYISDLEAQTYNLDAAGNVVASKVEKKLIYEKKLNKRYAEKVFTFPEAKVGSVIEYRYSHNGIGLIDWYFQRSIPVRYSRFVLDFPQEVQVAVTPFTSNPFEKKDETTSTRKINTYTMSRVPALHDEPFIINEDFYRDRLVTKVVAYDINGRYTSRTINWPQVVKALMDDEDFGVQVKKNIPRTADLDEKLKTISSPYNRMKTVYKYVQENMQWNEYTSIWAMEGVKSAWKDKKGTVGEINLILVNLLKDAGLNAHPILVSTHNNGVVNTVDAGTYEYPGYNQFDKVMAYLELDGKAFVLDASQKNNPVHLIPAEILYTQGLVIEKYETFDWGWKELWNQGALAKNIIRINATIEPTGKMSGDASIASYDYARLSRIGSAKGGKEKFIAKYISESNANVTVDNIEFDNLESDSLPLLQKIKFSQSMNTAGDYNYFSANVLTGLEKNPFVADNRLSDVFFGYNQKVEIYGNYRLPEGYQFDELPKNVKMIMPDTSIVITRLAQVTENLLQTKIDVEFRKPVFQAEEYPDLQEFYKRLFDILNEQFVVRKKS
ncbi:MAG TPA: DUF3857 domain-containing protein [Flavisolibacter sp.]|jgi:hypothetical protein|nr:DUF3857 domain-containing protein [Flavisolibacter sp.]